MKKTINNITKSAIFETHAFRYVTSVESPTKVKNDDNKNGNGRHFFKQKHGVTIINVVLITYH